MPKKTARGQRAIQRKTARHEEKKRALARVEVQVHRPVSTSDLRPAANWPVLESMPGTPEVQIMLPMRVAVTGSCPRCSHSLASGRDTEFRIDVLPMLN